MTRIQESPCCGWAVHHHVDPETEAVVRYECSNCGETVEACHTKQSDGSYCERLAEECRHHGDE